MSTRKAIDPAVWLKNWQIAQREARRIIRRVRRQPARQAAAGEELIKARHCFFSCPALGAGAQTDSLACHIGVDLRRSS